MNRADVDLAVEWAASEGWNPGLYDAESFFSTDPKGFFVGCLNDEPIAVISAVKYQNNFGFLGFYIVKPQYRGQGYGIQIWNAGMEYLKDVIIGLDGVVDQQYNYRKSGFELFHKNVRYHGKSKREYAKNESIVSLTEVDFDLLCSYDRKFFPAAREMFLKKWIEQPESSALAVVEEKEIKGYGVMRKCRSGYKIGPLFAENKYLAELIFSALQKTIPSNSDIYLDIPVSNSEAINLAGKNDMQIVFETARMYKGKSPELPLQKIFGVTSFELG